MGEDQMPISSDYMLHWLFKQRFRHSQIYLLWMPWAPSMPYLPSWAIGRQALYGSSIHSSPRAFVGLNFNGDDDDSLAMLLKEMASAALSDEFISIAANDNIVKNDVWRACFVLMPVLSQYVMSFRRIFTHSEQATREFRAYIQSISASCLWINHEMTMLEANCQSKPKA